MTDLRMPHSANAQRAGHAMEWRLRHWLQRYLPAELLAGLAAAMCASVADALSKDALLIVAASVTASTVIYYGCIVIREIVEVRRAYHTMHVRFTRHAAFITIRNLALEFGSAELLDSLLFSPVLLYVCIQAVPNLQLAVVLGEMASSAAFYIVVFVTHELSRMFAGAAHMSTHRPII